MDYFLFYRNFQGRGYANHDGLDVELLGANLLLAERIERWTPRFTEAPA